MKRAPILLLAAAGAACARAHAVPPPGADGRLPAGVRPTAYALDFTIDPSRERFSGRARIAVAIEQPTRVIVMHARGLSVQAAGLRAGRRTLPAQAALRMAAGGREEAEELTLTFDRTVPAGPAEIDIRYEAPFAAGLRGLYRTRDGTSWYAYTQFEPSDARRAFPCFDEPGWKAPFTVSATVPAGSIAVANMPERARHPSPEGLTTFEFERSPPLSTYLVAIAVGPFDLLAGATPVPMRLIATRGKTALGRLALETAAAQLRLLAAYFGRPYPYPKLDLVAVPSFGAGAMENAGLVTFREEVLLLDPARASTAARRAMASIVAHELAHQWFGDLVTMRWWDDLWLNEAFASFMSDKIVDQWRPQTQARLAATAAKSQVMAEDALASARRIRNPVRSTSEAQEAFDGITYAKGRAVLAMTESWLGEDHFREGLRLYLDEHAWGNATASDLYAALAEASRNGDVAKVMNSFTDQSGVPEVEAALDCRPGAPPALRLRQRQYHTLERQLETPALWRIPVCVAHGDPAHPDKRCVLLDGPEMTVDLPRSEGAGPACPAFVFPNAGEAGYYRVRMKAADLARLIRLPARALPDPERFGVVADAWAAVWSGELPAAVFLQALPSFRDEPNRLVWNQILEALHTADRALVTNAARPAFARQVRDLLGPAARRLGWTPRPDETDEQKLLREALLGTLGTLGEDREVLDRAAQTARRWLADPASVSADLARIALPLAARHGDAALHERLAAVLAAAQTPEARMLALAGLGAFEQPALIERTLSLILDGTIRSQDIRYVLPPMAWRRTTRDVTHRWVEANIDALLKVIPAISVGRLARLAAAPCDAARVRGAEAFLRPRLARFEGTDKEMRQAVEEGLRCAALADKERPATSAWLAEAR